ncbi:MAG: Sua5/YciO/YrdC/YwlC family protein, partial [Gemmatimonadota bacterium]|nr:Sua5/YciO/YrdC/YwlC family protein [Gemmatimonadota bacterium]
MTAGPRAVPFWSPDEIEAALSGAIAHLRAHKVLAYPTETVYGFGGGVDRESVANLIALKSRPPNKPFLLIVASSEMIVRLELRLTSYASQLAARFWPGPLTLVLPGGE